MDWQQAAALAIVGVTASVMVWSKMRPRKFSFARDTHCGCAGAAAPPQGSLVVQGRRGQRPEIIIKSK